LYSTDLQLTSLLGGGKGGREKKNSNERRRSSGKLFFHFLVSLDQRGKKRRGKEGEEKEGRSEIRKEVRTRGDCGSVLV